MGRLKAKDRKLILLGVLILVLAGAAVYTYRQYHTTSQTTSPSPTKGNSTLDEPTPSPSTSPVSGATPVPVTVAKPTLSKSSGNAPGSSVPAGAVIEFTCEGREGLSCEIILTDRTNPSHAVALPKQAIKNNGRGEYFATFDWNAAQGSWNVVAKVSNGAGGTALSDSQTLEVK
jgi:hypothetical protein